MLIDEPEAFLHPTLARLLGKNLAEIAQERGATLMASTHSSSFLLGVIDSRADVTLIRLTYDGERATTRVLESEQVSHMARSPLLRAGRVLDALFSKAAVVVEGDSDRVFYEAVNDSMDSSGSGIDQCLFINAQNKQTLYKIAGPLRRMGIPTVVVADFDVLNVHKAEWKRLLESVGATADAPSYHTHASIVTELEKIKTDEGLSSIHQKGAAALVENRGAVAGLIGELKKHGLFLVENGTVETWLPDLPRNNWIERALDLLDKDPQSERLDDARAFLGGMRGWIDGAGRGAMQS